jgi:hypothetical protein
MRKLLVALLLTVAGVAHADDHETKCAKRLALEAELAAIADQDIQTARLQQDTATTELTRAHGDAKKIAYWNGRLEHARADEHEAFDRYQKHRSARETQRAELRRIKSLEARR